VIRARWIALALSLLARSWATAGQPANVSLQIIEAYEQNGTLSLTVLNSAGKPMGLGIGQLGCFRLGYGANLASCLRSCDGRTSFELRSEPEYELVSSSIDQHLFQGIISHRSRGGALSFHTSPKGQYAPVASDVDTGACKVRFDGTLCLDQTAIALAKPDPIAAYAELLSASEAPEADTLAKLLSELRTELERAGITGYLRQGHFLSRNLRNAAPFLCQLKSRKLINNPKSEAYDDAFRTDVEELERSLEFMRRFNSLPQGQQSAVESE